MDAQHLAENSLFYTRLGDISLYPFRRVQAHIEAIGYLSQLHETYQRKLTGWAYLEFVKQLSIATVYALMSAVWLTILIATAVLDALQLLTIQMLRDYNFNWHEEAFNEAHQASTDAGTTLIAEFRQQCLADMQAAECDTDKVISNLDLLFANRAQHKPSLADFCQERNAIYQEFHRLRRLYTAANYTNRPWDNQEFLTQLNQLFMRMIVNTDELFRLMEQSYSDKKIIPNAAKMAESITGKSTYDHRFYPNDCLHFAYMAYILSFTEQISCLSGVQESMHHRFGFPVSKAYSLTDRPFHAHWIKIYNHFIEKGLNQYYGTEEHPLIAEIAKRSPDHAKCYMKVDPSNFQFIAPPNTQAPPTNENPHQHLNMKECLYFACKLLSFHSEQQKTTREFARETNMVFC